MSNENNGDKEKVTPVVWQSEYDEPVETFVGSEVFGRLFKDGMAMVENTAAYLDGPGRAESKSLPRKVALAYAGDRLSAQEICRGPAMDACELLPQRLLELLRESEDLYDRIDRLDHSMFRAPGQQKQDTVSSQLSMLEQAFKGEAVLEQF